MYGPGVCGVVVVKIYIHGCNGSPLQSMSEPAFVLHPNRDGSGCVPGHTILAFSDDDSKGAFLLPIDPRAYPIVVSRVQCQYATQGPYLVSVMPVHRGILVCSLAHSLIPAFATEVGISRWANNHTEPIQFCHGHPQTHPTSRAPHISTTRMQRRGSSSPRFYGMLRGRLTHLACCQGLSSR